MDYVSSSPRSLYREGGFYEDRALLDQLIGREARASSSVRALLEAHPPLAYERPIPANFHIDPASGAEGREFESSLRSLYEGLNRDFSRLAAVSLVELSDVLLSRDVLYPTIAGEPHILYETHRPHDRPYTSLAGGLKRGLGKLLSRTASDRIHLYLGSVGSSNYGHWLVDDLPRLEAIDALRAKYPGQELEITLPSHSRAMNEVRKQSIRRALIRHQGVSISFLNESQPRWFDRLHYVTPISYHPSVKSPRAIEYLRRALAPLDVKPRPSRIFVTRRTERGRRLSNLDVVRPFLEKRGFSIVDPEGMDFAEQVATFSAASIVVGSMGAAMTNTLFCPPQSTMIYLAPLGWVEPFYWDLARVSEHGYHVVYGQTERSAAPPHQRAFEISLEALTTLLDAVT